MQIKFSMDEMADDIRQRVAAVIGEQYWPDLLVQFNYSTKSGEDRNCFCLLNGTNTDIYTANMMVADGDERDCLCLYSPWRSKLSRIAKRGYTIYDRSKPQGRPTTKKNQLRSPNCPGCQLTIRDMKVSVVIKIFKRNQDILSKKKEITEFIERMGKEAEKTYGIHLAAARFIIESKTQQL